MQDRTALLSPHDTPQSADSQGRTTFLSVISMRQINLSLEVPLHEPLMSSSHQDQAPPPYSILPTPTSPQPRIAGGNADATDLDPRIARTLQRAIQDYQRSSCPSYWGRYRHGRLLTTHETAGDTDLVSWLRWTLELFVPPLNVFGGSVDSLDLSAMGYSFAA